jgi:hypothetical protein
MSFTFFTNARGVGHIPRAIKSKTSSGLERKMLEVQLRHKTYVDWRNIFYNPDEKVYVAWYVIDVDLDDRRKAEVKREKEVN